MGEGSRYQGVLLNWGGVMTSSMLGTSATFCESEELEPGAVVTRFRFDPVLR
jgi:hypothetical protein